MTGSVGGVCKDESGNPVAGATVEYANTANGRKYTIKTNKKGEYYSLGLEPGQYNIIITAADGKVVAIPLSFKGYADASRAYHGAEARRASWLWRLVS